MTAQAVTGSDYGSLVREHLTTVEQHNATAVADTAELLLRTVAADGTVFTAGAGHSLAAVAETFYRAGGLACVHPLYRPELLPLHGAASSTAAERHAGLAAEVLAGVRIGEHDVLVVFSTSGINPYPVELASSAGCPVVAFTSVAASANGPRRAGRTLAECATVVLDNRVRPGDASYPADAPTTAPMSSIVNAFLWNLVLVRLAERAEAAGVELPLWRSSNVPGGDEANAGLLRRYRDRIPELD
ncbi:SIS domain-containing protein [Gandjariella thermophila]|uniref:SIS domain-containing protein n=1 Tax=Gandjariella thermophila TaxID=1931992 RepID=A0A4D4J4H8_9PSEU|nr:SIS domain-containing protein [Gandjariella thermophila]GDY29658.1 SIS domain-containing protein [Gandjariella thermophila]